ncbi:MAG: response regulator transcription factor [Anaerolineae bacterium]|nr:response regulator transcription factor [Anaerolineae bacterium]
MPELHVLIIAENPLARMGLAALLANHPEIVIVGQSGGAQVAAEAEASNPDVLIVDWNENSAPDLPAGYPLLALLKDEGQAAEAWAAGARGLLLGTLDPERLVSAMASVVRGLVVMEPELVGSIGQMDTALLEMPHEALTAREMEVLQLVAEGLPNKIIAARLNITDHTVKFHVNAIMTKLGVQSRTEAVVRATKLGLIIL